jgi:hypothetical protein
MESEEEMLWSVLYHVMSTDGSNLMNLFSMMT